MSLSFRPRAAAARHVASPRCQTVRAQSSDQSARGELLRDRFEVGFIRRRPLRRRHRTTLHSPGCWVDPGWRGGSREGSGRDALVLLVLQRDCMVSTPAIQASQPSSPRALVHSQQVALTRAQDAAAELELSCDPSTTQLEAAEHQARWAPAMQRGGSCRRRGRSRRPHHRPRCAACHWSTWSAASCGQWACAGSFKVHLGST